MSSNHGEGARERWEQAVDREALGEALSPDERALKDRVGQSDELCRAEGDFYRDLEGVLDRARGDASPSDRLIQTALRVTANDGANPTPKTPSSKRTMAVVATLATLAAAAGAILVLRRTEPVNPPANASAPAGQTAPESAHRVRVSAQDGDVLIQGRPVADGTVLAVGTTIVARRGSVCLELERSVLACAGPETTLRLTALGVSQSLELERGRVAAVLGTQPKGTSFSVTTSAGVATAVGTVFTVEAEPSGVHLRVAEGAVAARTGDGEVLVRAGQDLVFGSPQPESITGDDSRADRALFALLAAHAPDAHLRVASAYGALASRADSAASPPSSGRAQPAEPSGAPELLSRARAARADGQYADAARSYSLLVSRYPASAEGRAALIGLAELRLTKLGDPAGALALYDRYLAGGGNLAQEAHYGKIQALKVLGRRDAAQRETGAFLARYPGSTYAASLANQSP